LEKKKNISLGGGELTCWGTQALTSEGIPGEKEKMPGGKRGENRGFGRVFPLASERGENIGAAVKKGEDPGSQE